MTSSEKSTAPAASPSSTNPPAPADTNPRTLRTPPLRVGPGQSAPAPSSPPTPLPTNGPGADYSPDFDPIDHAQPGSTRSSDSDGPVGKFDARAVKDIARGLVLLSSRYVHHALARTHEQIEQEVWIARGEDQRQIGDPLASIAQRHGAIDAPADVVNLIEAGLGALAYVLYHAGKAWSLRRGARRLADVDPLNEHQE